MCRLTNGFCLGTCKHACMYHVHDKDPIPSFENEYADIAGGLETQIVHACGEKMWVAPDTFTHSGPWTQRTVCRLHCGQAQLSFEKGAHRSLDKKLRKDIGLIPSTQDQRTSTGSHSNCSDQIELVYDVTSNQSGLVVRALRAAFS